MLGGSPFVKRPSSSISSRTRGEAERGATASSAELPEGPLIAKAARQAERDRNARFRKQVIITMYSRLHSRMAFHLIIPFRRVWADTARNPCALDMQGVPQYESEGNA